MICMGKTSKMQFKEELPNKERVAQKIVAMLKIADKHLK